MQRLRRMGWHRFNNNAVCYIWLFLHREHRIVTLSDIMTFGELPFDVPAPIPNHQMDIWIFMVLMLVFVTIWSFTMALSVVLERFCLLVYSQAKGETTPSTDLAAKRHRVIHVPPSRSRGKLKLQPPKVSDALSVSITTSKVWSVGNRKSKHASLFRPRKLNIWRFAKRRRKLCGWEIS
jgi:hypothetical protein